MTIFNFEFEQKIKQRKLSKDHVGLVPLIVKAMWISIPPPQSLCYELGGAITDRGGAPEIPFPPTCFRIFVENVHSVSEFSFILGCF